jgi:hypothetical protein
LAGNFAPLIRRESFAKCRLEVAQGDTKVSLIDPGCRAADELPEAGTRFAREQRHEAAGGFNEQPLQSIAKSLPRGAHGPSVNALFAGGERL